jgi:hypothetical protein
MSTTPPSLERLADAHDIQQVLLRYSIALDTRQLELLDDVFAAEARIDMHSVGVFDREGYRHLCERALFQLDATQHLIGPAAVSVDGDEARARSYYVAQHARNDLRPDPLLTIGGWYDDELARATGTWRITARAGTSVWWAGNPAVLGSSELAGAQEWRPGRACPQWLLPG